MSFTSWMVRRTFKKSDERRDAGITVPDTVVRYLDILYGTNPKWESLDVYRPADREGPLPVIVSVHGGGWVYGDKELYQYYCMNLAERGFAVVNFTYRLAPEYKFPAAIDDVNMVMEWVLKPENIKEYGFDVDHIFMVGDSAGAHMASLYTCICTDPDFAARFAMYVPKRPDGRPFVPDGLALNCGVYEIRMRNANAMTKNLMKDLLPGRGTAKEMYLINVVPHVNQGFPPCYVMTANADPLAGPPAQKKFVEKLRAKGVPVTEKTWGTEEAPLKHVFHLNIRMEEAVRLNDEECEFFRSLMKEKEE